MGRMVEDLAALGENCVSNRQNSIFNFVNIEVNLPGKLGLLVEILDSLYRLFPAMLHFGRFSRGIW